MFPTFEAYATQRLALLFSLLDNNFIWPNLQLIRAQSHSLYSFHDHLVLLFLSWESEIDKNNVNTAKLECCSCRRSEYF